MTEKLTDEQKIDALYTVMLGVPGTAAGGVMKTLTEILDHLKELNGSVRVNTTWRKVFAWGLGVIFAGLISGVVYLASTIIQINGR